jgi:hypothetical protein
MGPGWKARLARARVLLSGGWLLALSVLLIAATIWLVQRRAA